MWYLVLFPLEMFLKAYKLGVILEVSCVVCSTLTTVIKDHLPAGLTASKNLLPVAPGRNCVAAGPMPLWDFRGLQVWRLLEGNAVAPPCCHICVGPSVMYTAPAQTSKHSIAGFLSSVWALKTMSKFGKPSRIYFALVTVLGFCKQSMLQISRKEVSTGKEQKYLY